MKFLDDIMIYRKLLCYDLINKKIDNEEIDRIEKYIGTTSKSNKLEKQV